MTRAILVRCMARAILVRIRSLPSLFVVYILPLKHKISINTNYCRFIKWEKITATNHPTEKFHPHAISPVLFII
jgi:hypothetical protein